nr:hypothetical protein [Candidatus Sigynarchaeota archaeon]
MSSATFFSSGLRRKTAFLSYPSCHIMYESPKKFFKKYCHSGLAKRGEPGVEGFDIAGRSDDRLMIEAWVY